MYACVTPAAEMSKAPADILDLTAKVGDRGAYSAKKGSSIQRMEIEMGELVPLREVESIRLVG